MLSGTWSNVESPTKAPPSGSPGGAVCAIYKGHFIGIHPTPRTPTLSSHTCWNIRCQCERVRCAAHRVDVIPCVSISFSPVSYLLFHSLLVSIFRRYSFSYLSSLPCMSFLIRLPHDTVASADSTDQYLKDSIE